MASQAPAPTALWRRQESRAAIPRQQPLDETPGLAASCSPKGVFVFGAFPLFDSHISRQWQGSAQNAPRSRQMRQSVPQQPLLNDGSTLARTLSVVDEISLRLGSPAVAVGQQDNLPKRCRYRCSGRLWLSLASRSHFGSAVHATSMEPSDAAQPALHS